MGRSPRIASAPRDGLIGRQPMMTGRDLLGEMEFTGNRNVSHGYPQLLRRRSLQSNKAAEVARDTRMAGAAGGAGCAAAGRDQPVLSPTAAGVRSRSAPCESTECRITGRRHTFSTYSKTFLA